MVLAAGTDHPVATQGAGWVWVEVKSWCQALHQPVRGAGAWGGWARPVLKLP